MTVNNSKLDRQIEPEMPSNVFVTVDNSNFEEQILQRDTKFEAGLSSEELHCEKF